jgi:hypothetical protein
MGLRHDFARRSGISVCVRGDLQPYDGVTRHVEASDLAGERSLLADNADPEPLVAAEQISLETRLPAEEAHAKDTPSAAITQGKSMSRIPCWVCTLILVIGIIVIIF